MARRRVGTGARWAVALGAVLLSGAALAACSSGGSSPAVLLVGTFHGKVGQYHSIQAAVDAAQPGDWILIAPGDYHETDDAQTAPASAYSTGEHGGVVVHTADLHIRGMDRAGVIVDGTKAGAPTPCSSDAQWQNFGPVVDGKAQGRNGIVVFKADDVSIENLTACNFLNGAGDSGNQIWWNGGDGSGKIGMTGYTGNYLTGTSTFFSDEKSAAGYAIFSSNAQGPASWNQI
jgi:pectin methylesterase-like acyl-CoA thioesterase